MFFFQLRISHLLLFISICDLFTDSSSYNLWLLTFPKCGERQPYALTYHRTMSASQSSYWLIPKGCLLKVQQDVPSWMNIRFPSITSVVWTATSCRALLIPLRYWWKQVCLVYFSLFFWWATSFLLFMISQHVTSLSNAPFIIAYNFAVLHNQPNPFAIWKCTFYLTLYQAKRWIYYLYADTISHRHWH
jgi:hypothetical protein